MTCQCNCKRMILSAIAVFIFMSAFQWVYHGILLMGAYEATAEMWRPMSDTFTQYCAVMMASTFFVAFMVTYIFTCNYEGKGMSEGIRYGLLIGLLLAARDMGAYGYMPIDFTLVASWMLGSLLTGLGAGAVLSMTYKAS